MAIRKLTDTDCTFIIACLLTMATESSVYADATQDVGYVQDRLLWLINDPGFIGLVCDDKGFMLGYASQQWYTPDIVANEMLLYVLPEHRGSSIAARLIKTFETEAYIRNACEVRCGATANMNDERVFKLYERLGYERIGTGVRKRI